MQHSSMQSSTQFMAVAVGAVQDAVAHHFQDNRPTEAFQFAGDAAAGACDGWPRPMTPLKTKGLVM